MRPEIRIGLATLLLISACEPLGSLGDRAEPAEEATELAVQATVEDSLPVTRTAARALRRAAAIDLDSLAHRRADESVCETFARKVAEAALEHPAEPQEFLAELQHEFVGGTDDPFELKAGLREGRWNRRYFYAGHGGFRPEYDDAQRYPRGGNHQPGHFVSVLSVAARFGDEYARVAIAYAGDYDPGEEDDLRLSGVAIPLGAGLRDGSVAPAEVAVAARGLCRP